MAHSLQLGKKLFNKEYGMAKLTYRGKASQNLQSKNTSRKLKKQYSIVQEDIVKLKEDVAKGYGLTKQWLSGQLNEIKTK